MSAHSGVDVYDVLLYYVNERWYARVSGASPPGYEFRCLGTQSSGPEQTWVLHAAWPTQTLPPLSDTGARSLRRALRLVLEDKSGTVVSPFTHDKIG